MDELVEVKTSDESNDFMVNLMEKINDDKEMEKFISKNLFPKKSSSKIKDIENNLVFLKKMNTKQQALVKARAKEFEDSCDYTNQVTILLSYFVFVIGLYKLLGELIKIFLRDSQLCSLIVSVISLIPEFLATAVLGWYIGRFIPVAVKRRSTAVFFNTLINSLDFEEEPNCGQESTQKAEKRKEYVLTKKIL